MDTKIITKYGYKTLAICSFLFAFSLILGVFELFFGFLLLSVIFIYKNPEREAQSFNEFALLAPFDGIVQEVSPHKKDSKVYTKIVLKKPFYTPSQIRGIQNSLVKNVDLCNGLDLCGCIKACDRLNSKVTYTFEGKNGINSAIFRCGIWGSLMKFEKISDMIPAKRFGFMVDGKVTLLFEGKVRVKVCVKDRVRAGSVIAFYE